MIEAIHHVALILSREETLAFYGRLGFRETFRKKREYDTVVLLDGHGMRLEVFIDPRHPGRGETEPVGPRHLALKVDQIEKTIAELGLAKESVGPVRKDWTGVRFCFIRDPDGTPVELHE